MPRPLLVDRARQMADLNDLVASGEKQLAILSGRRQVGKTHLLPHAWPTPTRVVYLKMASLTADLNRQDLVRNPAEQGRWKRRSTPAGSPVGRVDRAG